MPLERMAELLRKVNSHLGMHDVDNHPFLIVRLTKNFTVKESFYKICDKHINQDILLLHLWSKIETLKMKTKCSIRLRA
jgi:hypothetical protein